METIASVSVPGVPDPPILSLYFSLRDERITQLIIIHNRALA
jgi:hypothetical protein